MYSTYRSLDSWYADRMANRKRILAHRTAVKISQFYDFSELNFITFAFNVFLLNYEWLFFIHQFFFLFFLLLSGCCAHAFKCFKKWSNFISQHRHMYVVCGNIWQRKIYKYCILYTYSTIKSFYSVVNFVTKFKMKSLKK